MQNKKMFLLTGPQFRRQLGPVCTTGLQGKSYRTVVQTTALLVCVTALMFVLLACGSSDSTSTGSTGGGSTDSALVGDWRILTETIYFDNGLTQQITPVTRNVTLSASGAWQFGSSTGTWSVSTITDSDWTDWAIDSYGPTRKVTLDGWNDSTEKGPIDESGSTIDFFWIIYSTTSEENGPGTIWMKMGPA